MLEKNAADPFREWKEKHVVTKGRRPVRHGKSNVLACDHSAAANEQQRRARREPGKTSKPTTVATICDRRFVQKMPVHGFENVSQPETIATVMGRRYKQDYPPLGFSVFGAPGGGTVPGVGPGGGSPGGRSVGAGAV